MAKPFKIFLWIVGVLLALLATAAIAIVLVFNPNDYKGEAAKAVKEGTGRELTIAGDIKLTLFPWLGASVAGVTLGNAKGFGPEPFAQVGDLNVGVKLMPLLLGRRLEVARIRVDGLALNLARAADGTDNWSDLSKPAPKNELENVPEPPPAAGPPVALSVGGVEIRNATFSYTDKQSGAAYKIADLSVETGAIQPNEPLNVVIAFIVNSAKPALESDVKIAFTVLSNLDTKFHEVKDLKVDTTSKGAAVPGGKQKASLRGHAIYDGAKGTFTFSDGALEAAGLTLNASIKAEGLSTETPKLDGKLSTNTFNPKELAKSFGAALPPTADAKALTAASFAANIAGDPANVKLDGITLKLDQTTATGLLTVKNLTAPIIQFALKADSIDADRYMAPAAAGEQKKEEGGSKEDFKKMPIPVEVLDAVNAHGTVELGALKLKGLQLSNVKVALDAAKGQAKTEEMTASLYGGRITQSARLTHNSPWKYDLKMGLDAVNSAPLLKDLIGKSYLSGLGNFDLKVSSGGETVGAVLQALNGTVGTSFDKGAVEGFDLEQTLANAKALYRGEPAPAPTGPKRTEFRDLKAAGKIVNGVLDTDTLDVKGSWYQLGGDGKVSLVDQTVDYTLLSTVSGDKYKDLQGFKIPVAVTGSWFDPKVKVDLKGMLKGQAKQQIQKQEEKAKEKAKEKFGDFLRKKLGPPTQPAPAPSEPAPPPAGQPKPETPPPSGG